MIDMEIRCSNIGLSHSFRWLSAGALALPRIPSIAHLDRDVLRAFALASDYEALRSSVA